MDARTQRRINRAKRRDEILKKEEEEKKKKWIRGTAKTRFIQKCDASFSHWIQHNMAQRASHLTNATFVETSERLCSLEFTDDEKKLLAETRNREREQRQQFARLKWPLLLRKIEHNVAFTQELVRANNMLIGREVGYKRVIDFKNREIARLKRQLDEANKALDECKK